MTNTEGFASLLRALPEILKDGESELPDLYQPTLHRLYTRLTNLVGLSKKVGNHQLRSGLIQGALAYACRMKEPKSSKDRWLKDLIERAGTRRAAFALANKNG